MACPSSMASERKPPELTPSTTFDNISAYEGDDYGRSFALVAGVAQYPQLGDLPAAQVDLDALVVHLRDEESFDEIVLLRDDDVSLANLEYFLQGYFPNRARQFGKSRFIFAYSGHGWIDQDGDSYLVRSNASSFNDLEHLINLRIVKTLVDEVVQAAYHSLVLLNSCHSGAFLLRTFGNDMSALPIHPGAHAITGGGTTEPTWVSTTRPNPGSVFFEKVFSGLSGEADVLPLGGDGIITAYELAAYVRSEVSRATDQVQNPQLGDISRGGSRGSFFFLSPDRFREAVVSGRVAEEVTRSFGFVAATETAAEVDEILVDSRRSVWRWTLFGGLAAAAATGVWRWLRKGVCQPRPRRCRRFRIAAMRFDSHSYLTRLMRR